MLTTGIAIEDLAIVNECLKVRDPNPVCAQTNSVSALILAFDTERALFLVLVVPSVYAIRPKVNWWIIEAKQALQLKPRNENQLLKVLHSFSPVSAS